MLAPSAAGAYGGFIFHKSDPSCYQCGGRAGGRADSPAVRPAGQDQFETGSRLFESSQYESALSYLEQAAALAPGNVQYQRWLAACLSRLGRSEEAVQALNRLLARPDLSAQDRAAVAAEVDANNAILRERALNHALQELDASTQASALDRASQRIEMIEAQRKLDALDYRSQAQRILRGIRRIEVPPPIPSEEVLIKLGQLPPKDDSAVERWGERGLAALDMFAEIKGGPGIAMKATVVLAKGLFADLDGAQVYITRKNSHYEKALAYLKDPATHDAFVEITRRLRDGRPLPENASIDMVRSVQAVTDPRLGSTSAALVWDAMMSPEAKNAALTRLGIEAALQGVGQAAKSAVKKEMIAHDASATEAVDFLSHAKVALGKTSDPVARQSLVEAIALANDIIEKSYRIAAKGMAKVEKEFARRHLEAGRRIRKPQE
jgi:tetratricopeptide (TPR) repeat protein